MLQGSDAAELRALQRKAYGRDGGLTPADAARLHALETARAETPAAAAGATSPEAPATAAPVVDPADIPRAAAADGETSGAGEAPRGEDEVATGRGTEGGRSEAPEAVSASGLRRMLRQHWRLVAASAAVLLMVGLAAGWALFGRAEGGLDLTAEQQERRAELQADGDFDAGSLRAIGQDDDALVWYATKDDGEMICLTLDIPEESATQCHRAEDFERDNGLGISVSVTAQGDDDGTAQQIWASVARATSGEMVAFVQRWDTGREDWLSQFEGKDRERAKQFVEEGFQEYSFSIVGYFAGEPVWSGQKLDDGKSVHCLVVDYIGATECGPSDAVQASGESISIEGVSVDESGASDPWSITLTFTPNLSPYLVITGDVPPAPQGDSPNATVKPGETLELGGEFQDPIQVEIPSEDSDG